MNNFNTAPTATESSTPAGADPPVPKHLESLVTTIFQSIFPPLSPQSTPLTSIKRVLMLNREPPSDNNSSAYTIDLRHYAISTKVTGLPKPIRRLANAEKVVKRDDRRGKGVPNLAQLDDVADYLLDPAAGNYTSGSESEPETDAEVEVLTTATKKIYHKSKQEKRRAANGENAIDGDGRKGVEKRAVKLSELGPRMKLRLVKVEEGLCEGKVMWHEFIAKTKEEETKLDQIWEARRKEKEERKRIQKENVAKKRKEKAARGAKADGEEDENEDEEMNDYEDWDSEDLDAEADNMDEGL
jgi:ribosome biogenesis protein SSF1/2